MHGRNRAARELPPVRPRGRRTAQLYLVLGAGALGVVGAIAHLRSAKRATRSSPAGERVIDVAGPPPTLQVETVRLGRRCTCEARAGDAWPVRFFGNLIGYYCACPACGSLDRIRAGREYEFGDQDFSEDGALSFGPGHTCPACGLCFRLDGGRFVVVRAPPI